MYQQLMDLATLLIFAMFIPANGFPILFATTSWKENAIGKSLMVFAISFAALIDFTLLFRVWVGEDIWHAAITISVFAGINIGLWWIFITIALLKRENKKLERQETTS